MIVVALLGFSDATFLAVEHYRGVVPPCGIVAGCATVTTSKYSFILGIPVALLGALYYLSVLLLGVATLESGNKKFLKLAAVFTPVGFLFSAWFVFLQLFVIHAICIYCMGSAISSTILFIAGMLVLFKKNSSQTPPANTPTV